MSLYNEEFVKKVEKLKRYGELDGCSLGDYVVSLCMFVEYRPDAMSEQLENSLIQEVQMLLDNFEDNCEIIKTEHTHKYFVEELEWI